MNFKERRLFESVGWEDEKAMRTDDTNEPLTDLTRNLKMIKMIHLTLHIIFYQKKKKFKSYKVSGPDPT